MGVRGEWEGCSSARVHQTLSKWWEDERGERPISTVATGVVMVTLRWIPGPAQTSGTLTAPAQQLTVNAYELTVNAQELTVNAYELTVNAQELNRQCGITRQCAGITVNAQELAVNAFELTVQRLEIPCQGLLFASSL